MTARITADTESIDDVVPLVGTVAREVRLVVAVSDELVRLLAGCLLCHPIAATHTGLLALDAIDGPGGLRPAGWELEALASVAALAVRAYTAADEALDGAQLWLVDHPQVVGGSVRAVTRVSGLSEASIAGLLCELYPDGRPQVTDLGAVADSPPASVADLMTDLHHRSDLAHAAWNSGATGAAGSDGGTIDVRRVVGPVGTAWIVDLPGTSRWDLPGPWAEPAREHDAADFGGDVRLMAGGSTVYERGVVDALRSLPVRPGEPILLAGHSEGGMAAMGLSSTLRHEGYDVTCVLTAGSPIAGIRPAPGVGVLALENTADIVPELDGAPNPALPGWATLRFPAQLGSVLADHGFTAYAVGAKLADRSPDPAVAAWRERAVPFLSGTSARTWRFRIERMP